MTVNKVILVGRLGAEPELKYTANGDAICNFSIATSETRKDKQSGEKKTETEWHKITIFGKLAEVAGQWLKKGSNVYLEGKIKTEKWQDKATGADKYTTKIIADIMKMLGDNNKSDNQQPQQKTDEERREAGHKQRITPTANTSSAAFDDEDVGF